MFNKEVCKKCSEAKYGNWGADEEYDWRELGLVSCFIQPSRLKYINVIISDLPNECPYRLEHLIMEQDSEKI